jgi:hypothetical protein
MRKQFARTSSSAHLSPRRMQRTRAFFQLRWLGAFVGMGLYLLASTPLTPLLTATLAWIDGGHTIALVGDGDSVRVVLGHVKGIDRWIPTHHHCLIARALVALAEPSTPRQPDHILHFGGRLPTISGREREWTAAPLLSVRCPRLLPLRWEFPASHLRCLPLQSPESPPPTSELVFGSTVFLI